jgi:hypothetical protein
MNALHIVLLILALLLAVGAAFLASRPDPVVRYGLPLLASAVAVFLLDQLLFALRVYT